VTTLVEKRKSVFYPAVFSILALLDYPSAHASQYENWKCPDHSTRHEEKIAEVDSDLLPNIAHHNQGATGTCGIHAPMVLVNSIWKLHQSKEKRNVDINVTDAMFRYSTPILGNKSSLPFLEDSKSFLLRVGRKLEVSVQGIQMMKSTLALNDDLLLKLKNGPVQSEFVRESVVNTLGIDPGAVDWKQVSTHFDQRIPAKAVSDALAARGVVPLPPFRIEPWDVFKDDEDLVQEFVHAFKDQNPVLPMSTGVSRGGHIIAITGLTKVECRNQENKVVKTFHQAEVFDSEPETARGSFTLEAMLARTATHHQSGFTKIIPCPSGETRPGCGESLIRSVPNRTLPLFHFAKSGDIEGVADQLKQKDTDVNEIHPQGGRFPLFAAIEKGFQDIAKKLIEDPRIQVSLKTDIGSALCEASEHGQAEIVSTLLDRAEAKDRVEMLRSCHKVSDMTMTPLYLAARGGHLEVVKVLLKQPELDVNKGFEFPIMLLTTSPLKSAIENKHDTIVQELMKDPRTK
jgi:hypothetical protein